MVYGFKALAGIGLTFKRIIYNFPGNLCGFRKNFPKFDLLFGIDYIAAVRVFCHKGFPIDDLIDRMFPHSSFNSLYNVVVYDFGHNFRFQE